MIVVKANRNQRLGNLLFNIGMAYTIQSKLPNHPEIQCFENNLTRTEYFRNTLNQYSSVTSNLWKEQSAILGA